MSDISEPSSLDPEVVAAAEQTTEPPNEQIAQLQQEITQLKAKVAEYWELVLRTKADMENAQRRAMRDVTEAHKYALERFMQELLPVLDGLEQGLKVEAASAEALREGAQLTLKMLLAALAKAGVQEVNPENETFNPDYHEAMLMQPQEGVADSTVLQVFQKGYLLNGRLLRPARVVVATKSQESA